MDFKQIINDEYELQYYNFSSSDFITHFKNEVILELTNTLDEYVNTAKAYLTPDKIELLLRYRDSVINKCTVELNKEIKSIEHIIRQFFSIPDNVLLPSDKYQRKQYTVDEVQCLTKEVEELQKECLKEQLFISLCKKELEILNKTEMVKVIVDKTLKKVEGLTDTFDEIAELSSLYEKFRNYNR